MAPRSKTLLGRTYLVIGWGIILVGAIHMFTTTRLFSELNARAIWFFSGGIAMALLGTLNLLNYSYGSGAPGVRRVCIGANFAMALFAAVAGKATNASIAELVMVLGLTGGATALSLLKGASKPRVA